MSITSQGIRTNCVLEEESGKPACVPPIPASAHAALVLRGDQCPTRSPCGGSGSYGPRLQAVWKGVWQSWREGGKGGCSAASWDEGKLFSVTGSNTLFQVMMDQGIPECNLAVGSGLVSAMVYLSNHKDETCFASWFVRLITTFKNI